MSVKTVGVGFRNRRRSVYERKEIKVQLTSTIVNQTVVPTRNLHKLTLFFFNCTQS